MLERHLTSIQGMPFSVRDMRLIHVGSVCVPSAAKNIDLLETPSHQGSLGVVGVASSFLVAAVLNINTEVGVRFNIVCV